MSKYVYFLREHIRYCVKFS